MADGKGVDHDISLGEILVLKYVAMSSWGLPWSHVFIFMSSAFHARWVLSVGWISPINESSDSHSFRRRWRPYGESGSRKRGDLLDSSEPTSEEWGCAVLVAASPVGKSVAFVGEV